ncbi:Beta-1,4 N-acetylgalactosaminyltransferase 2 [Chytriomyces hyalinus]|nr:Beta-1,4 N-acetylgalactosaminyltransferase 2 [Chytriomyces hyalinus]
MGRTRKDASAAPTAAQQQRSMADRRIDSKMDLDDTSTEAAKAALVTETEAIMANKTRPFKHKSRIFSVAAFLQIAGYSFGIFAVAVSVLVYAGSKFADLIGAPGVELLAPIKDPSPHFLKTRTVDLINRLVSRDSPTIHLMWTTPASTFTLLNFKVLDSYLYHDPNTTLIIHATDLNASHFAAYTRSGYKVHVRPLSDESILQLATTPTNEAPTPCPGLSWIQNMAKHRVESPYFYSHLTDYLRFCILYKFGGTYSDFDAIQLNPWIHPNQAASDAQGSPISHTFIGADSATGTTTRSELGQRHLASAPTSNESPVCPWCLNQEDTYLAPGVMGCPAGHPLVRKALEIGFERTKYDPLVFNAVGPKAVTLAYQELETERHVTHVIAGAGQTRKDSSGDNGQMQVLKQSVLYPYSYLTSWKVFEGEASSVAGLQESRAEAAADRLARKSLSLHLYGHMTKGRTVNRGSILEHLVKKQSLIKRDFQFGLNMSEDAVAGHELKVPRYLEVARHIEQVPHVRVMADTRGLSEALTASVTVRAKYGVLRVAMRVQTPTSKKWNHELSISSVSIAEANIWLSRLMYHARKLPDHLDEITVTVRIGEIQQLIKTIPVYNLPNLVTIMVKTTDRITKVFSLVTSVLKQYPDINIIVADDGHVDPSKTTKPEGKQRGFYYLPLPYDVGLSAGRNRMVERIRTKYVLTLDDDFTLNEDSPIGHLIHALEKAPQHNSAKPFDIAAAKIPADEGRFGVDYCGIMSMSPQRTLQLKPGSVTPGVDHEGCTEVEFVPNVFVARTKFLRESIRWDETLKLGEHEDFFWRTKKIGARVLTCPGVIFYHDQVAHWKGVTEYDRKRGRVFSFMKLALRKHGFLRLVSFGRTVMDLVLPQPIEKVQVSEILARSVHLSWNSDAASFKILQSYDHGQSWAPVNHGQGENYEHEPQSISENPDGFQRRKNSKNWITVHGLRPATPYIFRIHAGNRFNYLDSAVDISVTTLSQENEDDRNLIQNGAFESGSLYPYTVSKNNSYAVRPTIGDPAQPAHSYIRRTGIRSEITTVGYLVPHRSIASVSQLVPAKKIIESFTHNYKNEENVPRNFVVSMQSKFDALFDGEGMSWRVQVKAWFGRRTNTIYQCSKDENQDDSDQPLVPDINWGPAEFEFKEEFDRSNLEWQGRTVSVCVADDWQDRLKGVEVSGVLETFRGSVIFDRWVMVLE